MKAAIYRTQGPARDVLRIEQIAGPMPGPGQVRVRVEVSAINPTDHKMRSGATGRSIDEFQIPHHDGAGVIDEVGPQVGRQRLGQRVWIWFAAAEQPWGTAAEWTVVPEHQAVPLPESSSMDLGASLGVPAMTAQRCLFADGPIKDKVVLIAGGAGAVGHFAIQLAKHAGAHVIATVSDQPKAELAAAAGADLVVNYQDPDARSEILSAVPRVDRVVEVAPGANLELDLAVAGRETVIAIYAAEARHPNLPVLPCMLANITLQFVWLYGIPKPHLISASRHVAAALTAGALDGLPVTRFPLKDIAAAHEAAEGGVTGKVLVDINEREPVVSKEDV